MWSRHISQDCCGSGRLCVSAKDCSCNLIRGFTVTAARAETTGRQTRYLKHSFKINSLCTLLFILHTVHFWYLLVCNSDQQGELQVGMTPHRSKWDRGFIKNGKILPHIFSKYSRRKNNTCNTNIMSLGSDGHYYATLLKNNDIINET